MAAADTADAKVRFSRERHLSSLGPDDEDDDELSESLDAMLRRRESGRRRSVLRPSPKRGVSPLGSDSDFPAKSRRRSSTITNTSCEETQISMEAEPVITEEQMFENIKVHKELIDSVKKQPWKMKKRLKIVRKAKAYVRKHEGELEQRLAQSKNTKDVMARYSLIYFRYWERLRRQAVNLAKSMIPWEMRIKRIESHFGSAVASYFVFLRWVFWINIVMSIFIACFVIIPEVLAADRSSAGDRKDLLPGDEAKAFNLQTLWDFEGFLRYSPIFYGYYTNKDKTRQGYRIPFAYFMTLLGVYGYSFAAILQRMAENTRQSKLSDKDDDCTFTWKLFTSWDYMIGNSETADNKVASILMSFKENILEEREKSKEERDWKVWALRVLANLLVLILLVSSAYAVVLVVERSREPEADDSWWRQNESTVIISLISLFYPNLFDLIGLMENNHPRTQLQLQLARIMILYLLNLYTLIFSLFSKVDEMSAALKSMKPSTTIAPFSSTSMPSTIAISSSTTVSSFHSIFGVPGGGLFPTLINGTAYPGWNTTTDDLPLPANLASEIMQMFNLSADLHQLLPWNATCLAVRVNCDSKQPLLISNDTQLDAATSTAASSWDSEVLNSTYLTLTSLLTLPRRFLTTPKPLESASLLFRRTTTSAVDAKSSPNRRHLGGELSKFYKNTREKARGFQIVTTPAVRTARTLREAVPPEVSSSSTGGDLWFSSESSWWNLTEFSTTVTAPTTLEDEDGDEVSGFFTLGPGFCVVVRCADSSPTPTVSRADDGGSSTANIWEGNLMEVPGLNKSTREHLRKLCWETMFGQDLVKLTIMDLVMTVISILITDFMRALIVRVMNHCCCWDLEKQFPGYGDFKIAENILHLVNNQGMIWMGMFFAPGIPGLNMVKIVLIMYVRSWAVLTCNIPHETVFKASNSSNFYYMLLLTMLFLCTLPVGYAIVWLEPSWHCGPFSQYSQIYKIFTSSLESILPDIIIRGLGYAASPGIIIPLLVLLLLIIYYLNSVANSLREANKDLKNQLRRERTEERRKVFQMADSRNEANRKNKIESKVKSGNDIEIKMDTLKPSQIKLMKEKVVIVTQQTKKIETAEEEETKVEKSPKVSSKKKEQTKAEVNEDNKKTQKEEAADEEEEEN